MDLGVTVPLTIRNDAGTLASSHRQADQPVHIDGSPYRTLRPYQPSSPRDLPFHTWFDLLEIDWLYWCRSQPAPDGPTWDDVGILPTHCALHTGHRVVLRVRQEFIRHVELQDIFLALLSHPLHGHSIRHG